MASQILTVAKIGGDAGLAVHRRFKDWQGLRSSNDPNEWGPDQWPSKAREDADVWADGLRNHCHQPPVVFFSEFVDHWSSGQQLRFLGNYESLQMYGDRYELVEDHEIEASLRTLPPWL